AYLGAFVSRTLISNKKQFGVGGYLEKRAIYKASPNFNNPDKERDIHLGVDVWSEAGTPIYCPMDGIVHSFRYNDKAFDYGGTIVLQHEYNGETFHTLYGHLSIQSLEGLSVGLKIKAGTEFCATGIFEENGGWPPHLHFQMIKDMEDFKADYYGACSTSDIDFFKENCPDPTWLMGLDM
ncbi:MAG: peptidoglycan DD-metalloendopeptidase family protein, partial [Saprospiraceae bacterium]